MAAQRTREPGKAFLVTGASSGIGEACALRLDRLGYRVFAGVRKPGDAQALRKKATNRLTPVMLDVTGRETIAEAALAVEAQIGDTGLAGLVNNAGVARGGPLEFLPVEELEHQLHINVTGQIAVTQAFLPLIRRSRGRIVNVGSVSGRVAFPLLGPYCASKFALEALTATLRMELHPWGIHVSIVEPAGIATPIWRKSVARAESSLPGEALQLYGSLLEKQRERAMHSDRHGLPVESVVRPVMHALLSSKPRKRYVIGRTARVGEVLRLLPDALRERLILGRLEG